MVEYQALYLPDLKNNKEIPYTYIEDLLAFENNDELHEVSEVLYNKNWIINKCINGESLRIHKKLFIEELNLPYTEIDIEIFKKVIE